MQFSPRSYCYLLLWFGIIAMISNLTPYFANDFRYMMIQGTQDPVTSFADIVLSQYRHYFEWGGRSVAHVIAQTLLWWGKPASAVAQALCYVTLVLFIYFNAFGIRPTLHLRAMPLFVITLFLFLQLRVYGEVVFNIVSSANYLWTTTLVLIFLLPYRISMAREITARPYLLWPFMFIFGVIAGWTNENTAAAVATSLGLYLLWCLKNGKLKLWQSIGYAGFLIGFALLIFAPGNQARLDSMEEHGFDAVEHSIGAIDIFFESLLVCSLLIISVIFLRQKVRSKFLHVSYPVYYNAGMWFAYTGLFSLFLMIFAPNFPARAATPFTIFMIVALVALSKPLLDRHKDLFRPKVKALLITVPTIFMLCALGNALWCTITLNNDQKLRTQELITQIEEGKKDITLSPMHVYTYKYVYVADVRANPQYWTNKIITKYLEVNSVVRNCDYARPGWQSDFILFGRIRSDSECVLNPKTGDDVPVAHK